MNDSVKCRELCVPRPTSTVSLEAWIKPAALPAAGSFASILTKAESYSLQFNGPRLESTIIQAGVRKRLQAASGAIAVGGTYHVVGTYDGTTQRLYINGTQVASTALSLATTNNNSLYIGSWNGSEELFKGTIDEPAVYGSVLSATRVGAHYEAGSGIAPPPQSAPAAVLSDAPVSYWRLGETSGTNAADERNANAGHLPRTPRPWARPACCRPRHRQQGGQLRRHQRLRQSHKLLLARIPGSSFTLEAWIKPTAALLRRSASVMTKAESYSLQFNGPRLEFTIIQSGTRRRLQTPSGVIVAGGTYHVVGTFDGTTQRLYVNGTQVASAALSGSATTTRTARDRLLGRHREFFNGTIDEPAVYGTVLSAAQVGAHYQAGLKLPKATTEAATGVTETGATLQGTVNPEGLSTTYQFEYGKTTSYGTKVPTTAKSAGSGTSGVAVSEAIAGLEAGTTYHYRVVATSGAGQ